MSKIETLRKQIQNGTYKCPAEKIAEQLLKKNPKLSEKPPLKKV